MKTSSTPSVEVNKILQHAVDSIKLGVLDYKLSTETPENSTRCISAARNLFAGVLILFKFKIASLASTPEQAAELIYKTKEITPTLNEKGEIEWKPVIYNDTTIDTETIKSRLISLKIWHDWGAVKKLKDCRNNLEHLHPKHPVSEIQKFIADLFPLLRDFIKNEMTEPPGALLGDAWDTMLETHSFFENNKSEIRELWRPIQLSENAKKIFKQCKCENCESQLLAPHPDDVLNEVSTDDRDFRYECVACHYSASLIELIQEKFSELHETPFDPDPIVEECARCFVVLYHSYHGICHWCDFKPEVKYCACGAILQDHEIENGDKCDHCEELEDKFDEYEAHIR
ncbi:hypothetical protein [Pseudomonas sp. H9]|uniref:hypothetical protein n=1 Tax=Pseudomonas sp. H9 TaxID=483968 RepID=UPI001058192E|nr:hypothetical protein [Pseudomonas sp. H9]TDF86286.1 hypothetical protein E1573_01575 [Pseudomonas sp. H9]